MATQACLGFSCVGPATKSSFFGHMKGQARPETFGEELKPQEGTFVYYFFVEHSLKWIFFCYLFDHIINE